MTWCDDGSVRIWDWDAEERATIRTAHQIAGAELSADLTRLLVCEQDYPGSAGVWDVATGKRIAHVEIPQLRGCAGFTGDGSAIVTWDGDAVSIRLLAGDLDFPADRYRLRIEALTGTRFDPVGFGARLLTLDEWKTVHAEYLEVERRHAPGCSYPEENLYRLFAMGDPERSSSPDFAAR